jgi:hypothetical protein
MKLRTGAGRAGEGGHVEENKKRIIESNSAFNELAMDARRLRYAGYIVVFGFVSRILFTNLFSNLV